MNANVDTLNTLVNQACKDKTSDITSASIDKTTKGLKLTASQKQYLSDWKKVISGLEATDYSNTGMCTDGQVYVAFSKAFVSFLPGLSVFGNLSDDLSKVTADQLAQIKSMSTITITNQDKLEAALPDVTAFLTDLKTLGGSLYNTINAEQQKNFAAAAHFANDLLTESDKLSTDATSMADELNAFDEKRATASTDASKAELAGIEYQKNHKVSNANLQLDTALPAFRIVEAAAGTYSDKHDGAYPHATNINALADIDSNVKDLKDKGYLTGFSYTTTGSSDTGYTLKAQMTDGTLLQQTVTPDSQSA